MARWRNAAVIVVLAFNAVGSSTAGRVQASQIARESYGRDLFEFCCATCHGHDARGRGPASGQLTRRPTDLTLLTRRHHGTFPAGRLEQVLRSTGRDYAALSVSPEMPAWGAIFLDIDPSGILLRERVPSLIGYLASIQR